MPSTDESSDEPVVLDLNRSNGLSDVEPVHTTAFRGRQWYYFDDTPVVRSAQRLGLAAILALP